MVVTSLHKMQLGQECGPTWLGIPTPEEVQIRVGDSTIVDGILIVATHSPATPLPLARQNVYEHPEGFEGSYDGSTVRVWLRVEQLHSNDGGGATLRALCAAAISFYFDIVHGGAEGLYAPNEDPAYYGAPAGRIPDVPHGITGEPPPYGRGAPPGRPTEPSPPRDR